MKLLSRPQQLALLDAAGRAYRHQCAHGWHVPRGDWPKSRDQAAWRHAVQERVTGRESLTMCCNADFEPLMEKFLTLAGEEEAAYEYAVRAATPAAGRPARHSRQARPVAIPDTIQQRELWRHKIREHCNHLGKSFPAYALGILRRQTGIEAAFDHYSAEALYKCFQSLSYAAQREQRRREYEPF